MPWNERREKVFTWLETWELYPGVSELAPRLQPLQVGRERVCCSFPWGSGYGVSRKPRPAELLPTTL